MEGEFTAIYRVDSKKKGNRIIINVTFVLQRALLNSEKYSS